MIKKSRICKEIPVSHQEIEKLVRLATNEIEIKGDPTGFYNQTLETIANAVYRESINDFWLIWDDETKEALGFAICSTNKDIDNRLTYWGTLAYADKSIRHSQIIKDLWIEIEQFAKQRFCKHFMMVVSRKPRAYQKLLGKEWEEYATLLKKDI